MVTISSPLKNDVFKKMAEDEGLVFVKKAGIKMTFENPNGNDKEVADNLKKKCKATPELSALYFQVAAE